MRVTALALDMLKRLDLVRPSLGKMKTCESAGHWFTHLVHTTPYSICTFALCTVLCAVRPILPFYRTLAPTFLFPSATLMLMRIVSSIPRPWGPVIVENARCCADKCREEEKCYRCLHML